jgi:threonine dehydratase
MPLCGPDLTGMPITGDVSAHRPPWETCMAFDVTLDDIHRARRRIAGRVRHTPTFVSPGLSALLGVETVIKLEGLQYAGSFKVRGCFNALLQLSPDELERGVVTVSGGNHAIAVSLAARALGSRALVLSAKTMSPYNKRLTEEAGGAVELCEDFVEAFAKAARYGEDGRVNIHAYDDPRIIAGHGTLGLELAEEAGRITHAFVSIGGGGCIAGVAAALKGTSPHTQVIGVETEGATTMTEALAAGHPVTIRPTSIARTLGAPFATERTLAAAQAFVGRVDVVPDAAAVACLLRILDLERVLVEPAAAAVLAAALAGKDRFRPDDRVALVLCGSNVALDDVMAWRAQFGV